MKYKEFHPTALITDRQGNKIKMILKSTGGELNRRTMTGDEQVLTIVTWEQFSQFVKEGRVQLFQDNGSGPVVAYSDEERAALRKVSKKCDTYVDDDTYWKSEMVFYDDCFEKVDGISIACVCCRRVSMVKQFVVQGCMYVNDPTETLINTLKRNSLVLKQHAANLYMANWRMEELENIICHYSGPVSVNTSSMRHLDNTVYAVKMPMFSTPEQSDVENIATRLEYAATLNPNNKFTASPAGGQGGVSKITLG